MEHRTESLEAATKREALGLIRNAKVIIVSPEPMVHGWAVSLDHGDGFGPFVALRREKDAAVAEAERIKRELTPQAAIVIQAGSRISDSEAPE